VLNAVNTVLYESKDNSACDRDTSVFEAGAEVVETRGGGSGGQCTGTFKPGYFKGHTG